MILSDNNVLLHEFTARATGYVEYNSVIQSKSESDIMQRLKILMKNQKKIKKIQFHHCDLRMHFD